MCLESHNTAGLADAEGERRAHNQRRHLHKLLALRRLHDAWHYCDALDEPDLWAKLGEAAISDLNVEFG